MEPQYAGADWLQKALSYKQPNLILSPLGRSVADLLGELYRGIYHMDQPSLQKSDWANDHHIIVSIGWHSFATFDVDDLTRLVFLAHHMALRVSIEAATHHVMRLMFHQRGREGSLSYRHPTLDEAVAAFKKDVSLPEYGTKD